VPAEAIPWARSAGLDLPPIAPYSLEGDGRSSASGRAVLDSARAEALEARRALLLVSPPDGLVLSLSRDLPLADQVLYVEALPLTSMRYVELVVNGRIEARRESGQYRFAWPLREGAFEIEARGLDMSGKELRSPVSRVQVLPP
jgi:hypothetical protein